MSDFNMFGLGKVEMQTMIVTTENNAYPHSP
jgi:hypothetical protein